MSAAASGRAAAEKNEAAAAAAAAAAACTPTLSRGLPGRAAAASGRAAEEKKETAAAAYAPQPPQQQQQQHATFSGVSTSPVNPLPFSIGSNAPPQQMTGSLDSTALHVGLSQTSIDEEEFGEEEYVDFVGGGTCMSCTGRVGCACNCRQCDCNFG